MVARGDADERFGSVVVEDAAEMTRAFETSPRWTPANTQKQFLTQSSKLESELWSVPVGEDLAEQKFRKKSSSSKVIQILLDRAAS
jgi:hypothetical protein